MINFPETPSMKTVKTLLLSSLLSACHFIPDNSTPYTQEVQAYGAWYLLNPADVRRNVVAGGLIICDKSMASQQPRACKKDEYTLVLLEKNKGYGCTDYVSTGKFKCEQGSCYGHLVHEDEIDKLKIVQDGERLVVIPDWGKKMIFERSTPEAINQRAMAACRKSR